MLHSHLPHLGRSRAENKSFSRSACVTVNALPRNRKQCLFFSSFLLYFPPIFKKNIAPRGDQMTAIKGNLRARGWCCFSRGQSIFAPWRSETQLVSSVMKQHLARPALESQRRLQTSAVAWKTVSHSWNFGPAALDSGADSWWCVRSHRTARTLQFGCFSAEMRRLPVIVSQLLCLFFCLSGEFECVDSGFGACGVKTRKGLVPLRNWNFSPPHCSV